MSGHFKYPHYCYLCVLINSVCLFFVCLFVCGYRQCKESFSEKPEVSSFQPFAWHLDYIYINNAFKMLSLHFEKPSQQ